MESREAELVLLGELQVALSKLGMDVQLRDVAPGLTIRVHRDGDRSVSAYVVLRGSHFIWWQVDNHHPATDVTGAAERIIDYLRSDAWRGAGS